MDVGAVFAHPEHLLLSTRTAREGNEDVMALLVALGAADEEATVRTCVRALGIAGGGLLVCVGRVVILTTPACACSHSQNNEGVRPRDLHALPEG